MTGETVFSTPWFSIEAYVPPGCDAAAPYYRLHAPAGVVIVPVTPSGDLVLIRQYRPVLDRWTLEFPAGGIDPGESPQDAVTRELLEETGYRCAEVREVLCAPLRLEREAMTNHFFVGLGAEPAGDARREAGITVLTLTPEALRDAVLTGHFDHVAALPILLLARWRLGLAFPGL